MVSHQGAHRMTTPSKYDVVVVGASVGGCTAAILYARHGLNVALVEKSRDVAHYKKVCTHYLQPLALGTLRKLGLVERIEAAGGRRNDLEAWTEWGWIRGGDPARVGHGYNIRRQTLDPILRNLALGTPGVSFHEGAAVCDLTRDARGRIDGVVVEGAAGRVEFRAPLVVAADGRTSRVAKLAGAEAHVDDNGRFTYYTYYRGVALSSGGNAQYWHLHPNLAYAFRNDDDTTLLGDLPAQGRAPGVQGRPHGPLPPVLGRGPGPSAHRRRRPDLRAARRHRDAEPLASRVGPRPRLRRGRGDGPRPDLGDRLQLRLRVGGLARRAHRARLRRRQGPPRVARPRSRALPQDPSVPDPLALHAHRRPLHGPRPQPGRAWCSRRRPATPSWPPGC